MMTLDRFFRPASRTLDFEALRLSADGNYATPSEVNLATIAVNNARENAKERSHRTVPSAVKIACVEHFRLHGVKSAIRTFSARYPLYNFNDSSVRRWVKSIQGVELEASSGEQNRVQLQPSRPLQYFLADRRGRPNILHKELLQKVKEIIVGSRIAGAALRTEDIIAIGHAVLTMDSPHLLVQNGGTLELSISWAKLLPKNLGYTLRKGATDKRLPSATFLKETKLQFQHQIFSLVKRYKIPDSMILNCDQTPLSYVNAGNYPFEAAGARAVPITGKGDKRLITGTFSVTADGTFLPMQLIYTG